MSAGQISGSLIRRNYTGFRGVDFGNRKDEIDITRSPDSINMWKNYKNSKGRCVESRPDMELVKKFDETIFGLFFFTYDTEIHKIIHVGKKLYDGENVIYEDMAEQKSQYFIYEKKLYIKDGNKYLVYDGEEVKDVKGYIPTTSIGRAPTGGGTIYEDVNMLTGVRKNSFCSDGESTEYHLDTEQFDSDYDIKVWVDDVLLDRTGYTADSSKGVITFNTAPEKPGTDGEDNVIIEFRKTIEGYRARIEKCTLLEVFDNRVFFSGNPDYPNKLWHCSLDNPDYCSDLDYYDEGIDDAKIKALVSGNNALWVMKEPSQTNTTIFYHNPTVDEDYGKVYPSTHSSVSIGCVSTATNFNDDIVFLSERGLEGISGDITTEQVVAHRSTFVDTKLLNEPNYNNALLQEWEGYLLVIIDKHIYLADSRAMVNYNGHTEYEWFYWEFDTNIMGALVKNGVLYLLADKSIYTLTKTDTNIAAYWTTCEDEFGYPQYQKTTNKKGCVVDMKGNKVTLSVKTDNSDFEKIKTYTNKKEYAVSRIKKKKWKSIQLKFNSDEPFGVYSVTLESYVGSYVKR